MVQIKQNADGSFSKGYSNFETTIIKSLQKEITQRQEADLSLQGITNGLNERLKELEAGSFSLADLQQLITQNKLTIEDHERRMVKLENISLIESYSKSEMKKYMVPWRVEVIPHAFDIPTNKMFDTASLDVKRSGIIHYPNGDINEPNDMHVPENSMMRFTIWAYASSPRKAVLNINYADRCVVIADEVVVATFTDRGGNFGQVPKGVQVPMKQGWTRIQLLIANETQSGGLVVKSDLYDKADYLTSLDYFDGMITNKHIKPGSITGENLSPNMDLVVHTIHATATDVPGVIIGNPEEQGILQIADGTISKSKDEPFIFSHGIRVNGAIHVTQLLIDEDFIRAGDGMIVKTLKDEYGYTKMYEIINDLRMHTGGGLSVDGNGQDGYIVTNTMKLNVDPEGGLAISGNAVDGYWLSNDMQLHSDGGIWVEGNARKGYRIKNNMGLRSSVDFLRILGTAWDGYTISFDEDAFYNRVKEIIKKESHVKDIISDIDFIKITDNGDGVHRLGIPDYNKMIPWIQKGQSGMLHASPMPNSIGPGMRFNAGNPMFAQSQDTNYSVLGFWGGEVPANTADVICISSQGGWTNSWAAVDLKFVISIEDPGVSGGVWRKEFYRTITNQLDGGDSLWNNNEMIHVIPIPVRDYWRHWDCTFYMRKSSGSGWVNARSREAWTDHSTHAGSVHTAAMRTQESYGGR